MRRLRIGTDRVIIWHLTSNGEPYNLTGKDITLKVSAPGYSFSVKEDLVIDGNILKWNFLGKDQRLLGPYTLTLIENDGKNGMISFDKCDAFALVDCSCKERGTDEAGLSISETEISTDLATMGVHIIVPEIGPNGNWWINGQDTGQSVAESLDITRLALEGRFPNMSVGFADDLVGRGESTPAEFSFRASGGKSIKDGAARIKRLKGNSVVWNQLAKPFQDAEEKPYEGEVTYLNNGVTISNLPAYDPYRFDIGLSKYRGHKVLILLDYANDNASQLLYLELGGENSFNFYVSSIAWFKTVEINEENAYKDYFSIYTAEDSTGNITLRNLRIIDLTREFGAGNEPTTIEEYYARKPIVADEYAYNEGEVIHMTAEGIKSVGDNAIEERNTTITTNGFPGTPLVELNTNDAFIGITADGYVDANNINNVEVGNGKYVFDTDSGGYGIALFVNALPNELYHWSAETNGRIDVAFYDANRVLISHVSQTNEARTPYNCEYICLCLRDNEDITQRLTFSNIMLTLVHSGWKQDTDAGYQPYWEDKLIFDERIKEHFPNGMQKWDMVYNRNGKGYVVKGTGVVDLGSLSWYDDTFNGVPTFTTQDVTKGAIRSMYGSLGGSILALYSEMIEFGHLATSDNKVFVFNSLAHSPNTLAVRDTSYTDAASFKAAMAGVLLYYQLAEPTIIEYNEPFNFDYRVADFGTELMLTEQPSAPIAADIIYQFNAVDMIREHELEIAELQSIIATMQAKLFE